MEEPHVDTEPLRQETIDNRLVYVYRAAWTKEEFDRMLQEALPRPLQVDAKVAGKYEKFTVLVWRDGDEGFSEVVLAPT